MPKKPQYASQAENELYEVIYWLTYKYTGHRDSIFQVSSEEFFTSLKATRKAEKAGVLARDVRRITARADFDARLDLAKEGYRQYRECFLIFEFNEKLGERNYRSGNGDVPEPLPLDYEYTGTCLPKAGILLHCYFRMPETLKEAAFMAIQRMIADNEIKL